MNGLQVIAAPLFGEPSSLQNRKNIFNPNNDHFKQLTNIFPQIQELLTNIYDIDRRQLLSGKTLNDVWSYHPLPIYKGGIAQRFLTTFFQNNHDWTELYNEYQKNLTQALINQNNIDHLSPIEKYEYLVGDVDFKITKQQWNQGKKYMQRFGMIPQWIGMCHGTAPASIAQLRPKNAITLRSYDNKRNITFYPSDIKALLSYAWATTGGPSAMMGGRCEKVIIPGVRAQENCLDTNPASFHLATINLLGKHKIPFMLDASAGNEVWNRTIVAYELKYFWPNNRQFTNNL